jgi:G2/mitotic-specific cyclin 2
MISLKDDAFVYFSEYTEEQLVPGFQLLIEDLIQPGFEQQYVCRKYANKKFLKASVFARDWAMHWVEERRKSAI